jgi:crossover junction endodeoxyribonuclease RusA
MAISDVVREEALQNEDLFREKPQFKNKVLRFSLPIPTSVNAMYFTNRKGQKRLTSQAEKYSLVSRAKLREIVEDQRWTIRTGSEWIYVDMTYYFPDRRIRDASNCLKLLMDVMQGIVYANDFYALPRIQSVELDKQNPRVEIRISMQSEQERKKALLLK